MAATVGATLTLLLFPARHAGLGPYSSGGEYYMFGPSPGAVGQVVANYTTDPMSSFAFTRLRTMSSSTSTAIQAMACYQVGDVIHVVTQIATGAVYYNQYDMATNAWVLATSETAVAAAAFAPTSGFTYVTLVVRSGGEVVIGYCAGLTAMSSGFNMWRYVRRTGTNTYSTPVNIDNGGSVNWAGGPAILGASDRVHFFFKSATASDAYQRTLSAANALQTFPSALDADTSGSVIIYGPGFAYDDGTAIRVQVPFQDVDNVGANTFVSVAKLDSADAPTLSKDQYVADQVWRGTSAGVQALVNDGATRHLLYIDGTLNDLFHDSASVPSGAWSTDINELSGAGSLNSVTPNAYTRSGTKYLAMVLDDAGTVKYAEIGLPATLTQTTFRGRNDDGNETTATWKAAAGADWTQAVDTNFRVRFLVQSSAGVPTATQPFKLHYSLNGGAYTPVTDVSSVVRASASTNFTDGTNTTEQLAGSGTFNAGQMDEVDSGVRGFLNTVAAGQDTEVELCLQIRSADVANNDTISLRLHEGDFYAPIAAYTDSPLITVSEGAAPQPIRSVGMVGIRGAA